VRNPNITRVIMGRVADNKLGYVLVGVCHNKPGRPKPYQARVRRGGKQVELGTFATAEEGGGAMRRALAGGAGGGGETGSSGGTADERGGAAAGAGGEADAARGR
jgi:hypothetical protein